MSRIETMAKSWCIRDDEGAAEWSVEIEGEKIDVQNYGDSISKELTLHEFEELLTLLQHAHNNIIAGDAVAPTRVSHGR